MTEEEIKALQEKSEQLEKDLAETRQESASRRIALKEFDGVDVKEIAELKAEVAAMKTKKAEESGKEEDIISAIKEQKDAEIATLKAQVSKISGEFSKEVIDKRLVSEAAKMNAINPDQVSILLKNNIRLSDTGSIEIVDGSGKVKYDQNGDNIKVEDYVANFMKENLHLARGVESGTGSAGGSSKKEEKSDDSEARMKKALDAWGKSIGK